MDNVLDVNSSSSSPLFSLAGTLYSEFKLLRFNKQRNHEHRVHNMVISGGRGVGIGRWGDGKHVVVNNCQDSNFSLGQWVHGCLLVDLKSPIK